MYIDRNNIQVELIRFRKKIVTLFTFTFAKLGILPLTRCLRCATDGSAQSLRERWCRQFARPGKVSIYDSLDRLANTAEGTASVYSLWKLDKTTGESAQNWFRARLIIETDIFIHESLYFMNMEAQFICFWTWLIPHFQLIIFCCCLYWK